MKKLAHLIDCDQKVTTSASKNPDLNYRKISADRLKKASRKQKMRQLDRCNKGGHLLHRRSLKREKKQIDIILNLGPQLSTLAKYKTSDVTCLS